ncbi:DUF4147 domain-containing protein [Lutimaribacter marinistellae]|uniref:DUF4147 domain-containing protein n=1 Tax=Lutimaribacter marinistellae TaxID=1820329 RepID=A0ABV7TJF2_9RHOB
MELRDTALSIWQAGVDAVGGYASVARALDGIPAPDRILAVGKAAAPMARAALDRYGPIPCLVVTKDGHADGLPSAVEVIEAAHPVPDDRSLAAGRALMQVVASMPSDSRLLLLLSGGASALAEDLVAGATLDALATLNRRLLAEGLDITKMNAARRKLSRIKGGGLLAAFTGHAVEVLAISDVPGDDLAVIGSGIGLPPQRPDCRARIVASNGVAREAAAQRARPLGFDILVNAETLHDDIGVLAPRIGQHLRSMSCGTMILGGEPTVLLPDRPGRGGRNQALALAVAREIAGIPDLAVVVGGTDGTDGPTDAAGGIVDGTTWSPDGAEAMAAADSGTWLEKHDALLVTGPTGTNVMDLLVAIRQ